ncbi:MAG: NUDIX domain-containing protein [Byssovorax sp.]
MPAQDLGELFDLFDRDGAPLGRSKPRRDVHRDGDWHRSLHIWVALREGPDLPGAPRSPHLLFQRRSPEKDTWPGALDAAVTGHLRAGESILDGLREAREEIGLELGPGDVVRLGLRRCDEERGAIQDRELQEIFATATPLPLAFFQPDPDEVTSLVVIESEAAFALFRGERAEAPAFEQRYGGAPTEIVVRAADFIPAADGYYAAVARSLGALLQGSEAEAAWILG